MIWSGENQLWDLISQCDPEEVQRNADVRYDRKRSTFELNCFDQSIHISLPDRTITGTTDVSSALINEFADYSRLSILSYLVQARDIPLSEQLVRPSDLSGGDIFVRGTHVLPLDETSDLFNNNRTLFLVRGKELGGSEADYGDMSLQLFPFPRVPIVMIIWEGDTEFPAKTSVLFDSSCTFHMPIDILWSTAMFTVKMMLYQD